MVLSPDLVFLWTRGGSGASLDLANNKKGHELLTRSPFKQIKRFLQEQQTHLEYTTAFRRFPLQRAWE